MKAVLQNIDLFILNLSQSNLKMDICKNGRISTLGIRKNILIYTIIYNKHKINHINHNLTLTSIYSKLLHLFKYHFESN